MGSVRERRRAQSSVIGIRGVSSLLFGKGRILELFVPAIGTERKTVSLKIT